MKTAMILQPMAPLATIRTPQRAARADRPAGLAGSEAPRAARPAAREASAPARHIRTSETVILRAWLSQIRGAFAEVGIMPPPTEYAGMHITRAAGLNPRADTAAGNDPLDSFEMMFLKHIIGRIGSRPAVVARGGQVLGAEAAGGAASGGEPIRWSLEVQWPDRPPDTEGLAHIEVPVDLGAPDGAVRHTAVALRVPPDLARRAEQAGAPLTDPLRMDWPAGPQALAGRSSRLTLTDRGAAPLAIKADLPAGMPQLPAGGDFLAVVQELRQQARGAYDPLYAGLEAWVSRGNDQRLAALGQVGVGAVLLDPNAVSARAHPAEPARGFLPSAYRRWGQVQPSQLNSVI